MKRKPIFCKCGHNRTYHIATFPYVCRGAFCKCKGFEEKEDEPEPPSEIIIERFHGFWAHRIGDRYSPIIIDGRGFTAPIDPMIVTLALKAAAAGPINVVWNL